MKLVVFILLITTTMAVPYLSSIQTWLASFQQPLKSLIDNPLRRSTIPQFILDARHPWILANQRKLERLPNAEAFLCSNPDSDSKEETEKEPQTCTTELEIPSDIFDNLEIDNNRAGISRPGWPNALERLGEMKRCQRALNQVKTLEVDIFVHREKYSAQYLKILEHFETPEALLTLFGDVLESMTNLETLKWKIPKEYTHSFEEAFTARNLSLPSIKHLEPGPSSHYLVSMCPNLERLENGGGFMWYHGYMPDGRDWAMMLIQAATSTPKLKRFAMVGGHDGWTPERISEVVKCIPQIESLGLLGSLGRWHDYTGYDTGDSGKLKVALEILSELQNLTHLDLGPSSDLDRGFDGGPGCGNAYFGKGGRKYLRQVTRQGAEATEKGGNIVVETLPRLKSFTIGGTKANVTRVEDKMVNATWPWTGRMDEWLMEVVPERSELWDVEYDRM
ncbi:uncharacterized protein LY89DRAFT_785850 [Mollisia scopiformis]|uniref:Uncharacterized protein n=1 Tax=Mollisia scopiformis TaxID=149040 RepID=A0A194WXU8_MOLSC|nr:uncharacterized protein LY89DRAFT_785850 [Mollisia scopiformis]KUJ12509.1 hypothetical protein LY89DRAFT_785850 [Mollisia scopiformis]